MLSFPAFIGKMSKNYQIKHTPGSLILKTDAPQIKSHGLLSCNFCLNHLLIQQIEK